MRVLACRARRRCSSPADQVDPEGRALLQFASVRLLRATRSPSGLTGVDSMTATTCHSRLVSRDGVLAQFEPTDRVSFNGRDL